MEAVNFAGSIGRASLVVAVRAGPVTCPLMFVEGRTPSQGPQVRQVSPRQPPQARLRGNATQSACELMRQHISRKYAENMQQHALNMQKFALYAGNMQKLSTNIDPIAQICKKYARICNLKYAELEYDVSV